MTATSRDPAVASMARHYDGDASTLRAARRDVVAWLAECGADEATRERGALIVSELASNALQASPGTPYAIHLSRESARTVNLAVSNRNAQGPLPNHEQWHPADVLSLRGRGLSIVDSLSEQVTVDQHDGAVTVTARLRIDLVS
jgi:anti-sigma regulatory factor (Ser/Thr protein kinase)